MIVDKSDPKWVLLEQVLKVFESRRVRQELAKHGITPVPRAGLMLRVVLTAMFFDLDISYVVGELSARRKLRRFTGIVEVPGAGQVYSFLARFSPEQFTGMVTGVLNTTCYTRRRGSRIIVDPTDIMVDLNWFKRRIKKADLEERDFKWAYSPSKGYYIGYKLVLALEYPSLRPISYTLLSGSPNDAPLFDQIMEELKRKRIIRNGDLVIMDKGFYSYRNYAIGITRYKVVPLIFPKRNFKEDKLFGLLSYPLKLYHKSNAEDKDFYKSLARRLKGLLQNWKSFKPVRGIIEDWIKLAKKLGIARIHRYTKRSGEKFVILGVLLCGIIVSTGIKAKGDLQRLAET